MGRPAAASLPSSRRYVSRMCRVISAALLPCSACSRTPPPQSAGCRAARRTRTTRCRAGPARLALKPLAPSSEMTCAVRSCLTRRGRRPWRCRPCLPRSRPSTGRRGSRRSSGLQPGLALRGRRRHGLPAAPFVHAFQDVRRHHAAPVGERRRVTAIEMGVTDTWPWPIATEIVSPGYRALEFQPLPLGRRDEAGDFVRQVDAAADAEAEARRPLVDDRRRPSSRSCRNTRRTTARWRGAGPPLRGRSCSST